LAGSAAGAAGSGGPAPLSAAPDAAGQRGATEIAGSLAEAVLRRLAAPAVSVLVRRGRRFTAAASAGDWGVARRLLASHAAESTDDMPPEFPTDEQFALILAQYSRAVPLERWHELGDAPLSVLPLVALADRGAAAVVTLRHRGQLVGLCVVSGRPSGKRYTDAELRDLERLAAEAGPALGASVQATGE
jgi:hypothetical protein